MPGNSFSLAVRVSCQIYFICLLGFLAKLCQDLSFSTNGYILGFIIMIYIDSKLTFREIPHMSVGRHDFIIGSQKLFNCLHLCR